MKAVVCARYGPPDVLEIRDLPKPSPGPNEILVRNRATTVTATDSIFRRGEAFFPRLFTGLLRPKHPIPGDVFAGVVEAAGGEVNGFRPGDEVYGALAGFGAHAEYLSVPEGATAIARKPANLSFAEAACLCDGALVALPFLRDTAKLQRGQRILINGASGAIGTFAVQLAKHFGAHVTGVCSGENLELAESLGADRVIDYTREDFTKTVDAYDVMIDTVGKTTFSACKRALKPGGVFIEAAFSPASFPLVLWTAGFGSRKFRIAATGLRPPPERAKDLEFLCGLAEAGQLRPVIDREFGLEEIAEASRHVDSGHKKGNVVVHLDGGETV